MFLNDRSCSTRERANRRKIGRDIYCWRLGEYSDGRYYVMDLDLAKGLSKRTRQAADKAKRLNDCADRLYDAKNALEVVNSRYRR